MSDDCYYDAEGCLVCPERPAVAAVPGRVEMRAVLGWTAGANSQGMLDGDFHTVFGMPPGVRGVMLGLKGSRERPTQPSLIEHGFYFQRAASADVFQVIERNVAKSVPVTRGAADQFEIRRSGGVVTYWRNGTLLYTSAIRSTGAKLVNTCVYASGDTVPTGQAT